MTAGPPAPPPLGSPVPSPTHKGWIWGGEGVSHGEANVYLQGLVVSVMALSLEFATQQFTLGVLPLLWNAQGAQPLSLANLQVMEPCNRSTTGGQGRG